MHISKRPVAWVYLVFAIAGGILPTLSNIEFVRLYGPGFDLLNFIDLANINPAAQSLSRDLIIGAGAISVWIVSESRRIGIKHLWIVGLSFFLVAFAFAAPLFLYLRELRLEELSEQDAK